MFNIVCRVYSLKPWWAPNLFCQNLRRMKRQNNSKISILRSRHCARNIKRESQTKHLSILQRLHILSWMESVTRKQFSKAGCCLLCFRKVRRRKGLRWHELWWHGRLHGSSYGYQCHWPQRLLWGEPVNIIFTKMNSIINISHSGKPVNGGNPKKHFGFQHRLNWCIW